MTVIEFPVERTGFDSRVPSSVRVHDALHYGEHHYSADRVVADKLGNDMRFAALQRVEFRRRAVSWLTRNLGIAEIIVIGSGYPVIGLEPHDVLADVHAQSLTLYVDPDATVTGESRALRVTEGDHRVEVLQADGRDVGKVWREVESGRFAVRNPLLLVLELLDEITDAEAQALLCEYSRKLANGSVVVLSWAGPELARTAAKWNELLDTTMVTRTVETVGAWLEAADLKPYAPGLVSVDLWRPDYRHRDAWVGQIGAAARVAHRCPSG